MRRQQQRGHRKFCMRSVTALLARVRRSDAVHLKKGDETFFCALLDEGLVPPGPYGKFGYVDMNRPYYDAAVESARVEWTVVAGRACPRTRPRPPPVLAPFIPSSRFKGERVGYVFKAGPPRPPVRPGHPSFVPEGSGLGYYLELE